MMNKLGRRLLVFLLACSMVLTMNSFAIAGYTKEDPKQTKTGEETVEELEEKEFWNEKTEDPIDQKTADSDQDEDDAEEDDYDVPQNYTVPQDNYNYNPGTNALTPKQTFTKVFESYDIYFDAKVELEKELDSGALFVIDPLEKMDEEDIAEEQSLSIDENYKKLVEERNKTYDEAIKAAEAYAKSKGMGLKDTLVYDMHFEILGEKVDAGKAKVTFTYDADLFLDTKTVDVLHIVEGKAVKVNKAAPKTDDKTDKTSLEIETDGFSPFVFVNMDKPAKGNAVAPEATTPMPVNEIKIKVLDAADGTTDITTGTTFTVSDNATPPNSETVPNSKGLHEFPVAADTTYTLVQTAAKTNYDIPAVLQTGYTFDTDSAGTLVTPKTTDADISFDINNNTIEIKNHKTPPTGSLKVVSEIKGLSASELKTAQSAIDKIKFTVKLIKPVTTGATREDKLTYKDFTAGTNEVSYEKSDYPLGEYYVAQEDVTNLLKDYTCTTTYTLDNKTVSAPKQDVAYVTVAATGTPVVTITNTFTKKNADPDPEPTSEVSEEELYISKVDGDTDGENLAGAKLQIEDVKNNNKVLEKWTSKDEDHLIGCDLYIGGKYKLVETQAPAGYKKADPIEFTVDKEGLMVINGETSHSEAIILENFKETSTGGGTGSIAVHKMVTYKNDLQAVDETYYFALFTDKACENRVSGVSVEEIKLDNSYNGDNIGADMAFKGLPNGTYYVAETDEDGNALPQKNDNFTIYATDSDKDNIIENYKKKVVISDNHKAGAAYFTNNYTEKDDSFADDNNKLTLTKRVLHSGNKPGKAFSDTFYASVYADEEMTQLICTAKFYFQNTTKNEVSVVLGKGSSNFPDLPSGSYYIAETDKDGNELDDKFEYECSYKLASDKKDTNGLVADNVKVTLTGDDSETVTIINDNKNINDGTDSDKDDDNSKKTNGSKTGDENPVVLYMALLAGALVIGGGLLISRRRKER